MSARRWGIPWLICTLYIRLAVPVSAVDDETLVMSCEALRIMVESAVTRFTEEPPPGSAPRGPRAPAVRQWPDLPELLALSARPR